MRAASRAVHEPPAVDQRLIKGDVLARARQSSPSSPRVVEMACSKPVPTISFSQIVKGRDASVRVTDDNMIHLVNLVMVAHGSSRTYASQVLPPMMHS